MQLDVLAFGAHPDDVELFAGGTLAKMASLGHAAGIIDMTRGEMGTRGTPAQRAREARQAACILGLKVRENLGLPDGNVAVTPANRLKVIRALRQYRPSLVLLHHWDDRHPDHVNTSRLVSEAAHHAGLARIDTGQERFRPSNLLYFMVPVHETPSFVVDVSEVAERRLAAIQAYKSQLYDPESQEPATYLSRPDFLAHIESIHSFYGTLIGTAKAEGFYMRGVLGISDPIDFFRKQDYVRFR
jgi:bacillithiol biosynthesis deacetylase BshB1